MRIEHLAIWTKDLEAMKVFYVNYFGAKAGDRYHNRVKKFTSYFLRFESGPRLELMHRPDIDKKPDDILDHFGITHFAIAVGSKERVNELTENLRNSGFKIVGEPRITGDGYYESVVLDPEQNRIEITV